MGHLVKLKCVDSLQQGSIYDDASAEFSTILEETDYSVLPIIASINSFETVSFQSWSHLIYDSLKK